MFSFFKSLPVRLLFCILAAILCSYSFEIYHIQFFYTVSLVVKELLFFFLPLIVFSYIVASLLTLNRGVAPFLIFGIFFLATLSNFASTMVSYGVGRLFLPSILSAHKEIIESGTECLDPLWAFSLPTFVPADKAMLVGLGVGLFFNFFFQERICRFFLTLREGVTLSLQKIFIPFLLPFYVFGYVLKMHFEGIFTNLLTNYVQVIVLTCVLIFESCLW